MPDVQTTTAGLKFVEVLVPVLLSLGVLYGIKLMSDVKTATLGNRVSALCMLLAIVYTMMRTDMTASLPYIIVGLLLGTLMSIWMTIKVKMIQMPQMVGLLNGLGGLASAISAILTIATGNALNAFDQVTSALALLVGGLTFSGSVVAAAKLHNLMPQKPKVYPGHQLWNTLVLLALVVLTVFLPLYPDRAGLICTLLAILSLLFGWLFAIRVGGADMPITISLLNSTSGVAAGIAGMALGDILLVSVGGIVGASGLILTQIMCKAMNRSLTSVLFGGHASPKPDAAHQPAAEQAEAEERNAEEAEAVCAVAEEAPKTKHTATLEDVESWVKEASNCIIIPGYGMALSQAQEKVKNLLDKLQAKGVSTRFAIHPVAGRMPGHMNVLLAEVDIDYELLCEMQDINSDFEKTDLVLVIGANDVINPAANTAVNTPIYGMPILEAAKAKHLVICNFDDKPGYAGVPNPLYTPQANAILLQGDAKESLDKILSFL